MIYQMCDVMMSISKMRHDGFLDITIEPQLIKFSNLVNW